MSWVTANLLWLSILGVLLILGSSVRLWFVKPIKLPLVIGLMLMLLVGYGLYTVAFGTPGQVETVDENERDGELPELPKTALERLRLDWDSEADADWPAALTLAEISHISYQPPHEAAKSYQALGFPEIMPVVASSMIGYVLTGDDVTVVVFRGTDFNEVSDWMQNVGVSATNTPNGQVHSGFFSAYQSMKTQVDAILEDRNTKHLWITGHSLGGALALLSAYDLEEVEKRKINGVMTFGQPMVARRTLADYIDDLFLGRYARFANRDDLVTRIPSSHADCGSLIWFTDVGIKRSKPKEPLFGAGEPSVGDPPVNDEVDYVEIKPLSEADFKTLKNRLRLEDAKPDQFPDGMRTMEYRGPENDFVGNNNMAAEYGASSLIDDHAMGLYVEKVRSLFKSVTGE